MPKAFDEAVRRGGRVRTKKLSGGRYIKIVYPKGGGKPIAGHVHKKKKAKK